MIDQNGATEALVGIKKGRFCRQRCMRVVRRVHLYSGLFMVPWILLYGITAFLFNHPQVFSDQDVRTFRLSDLEHTPMASAPSPASVAEEVVEAVRARAVAGGRAGASYRLVLPEKAAFAQDQVLAVVKGGGKQYLVELDVVRGTGTVQSRGEKGAEVKAPFAAKEGVRTKRPLADRFQQSLPGLLSGLGLTHEETTLVLVPELIFWMEGDGKVWRVSYNMQRGSLTATPSEGAVERPSWRHFFTRLHLAHGFPDKANGRWAWAVLVDGMFVTMVFWALSGILMAWQLKAIRFWGVSVLVLGMATAVALIVSMYVILVP